MENKKTNIFFIHTPFHLFISELLIQKHFEDEVNILVSEYEIFTNNTNWVKKHQLNTTGEKRLGHSRWRIYRNYLPLLKDIIYRNDVTDIFFSDIAWPINNVIFGVFRKSHRISIFQDGIGAYSNNRINTKTFLLMFVKMTFSKLGLCVPHYPYTGEFMGQDQKEITNIFGFEPRLLTGNDRKKVKIEIPELKFNSTKKIIFLDQPNGRIMPPSSWLRCRANTIIYLKQNFSDFDLFYKRHHKNSAVDSTLFLENGFHELDVSECIESFFARNQFDVVISYNSSALFNLKVMYGEEMKVVSLFVKEYLKGTKYYSKRSILQVYSLFKKAGIDIVSIDDVK